MDEQYLKGDLLQIYTKYDEIFEGHFHSISHDKSKITLYGVKELPKGIELEGLIHYYDPEITEIVKMNDPDDTLVNSTRFLKISQKEFEDVNMISKKYIYINHLDDSFHKAIEDLNQSNYIAVSTDGASMGRKCKMPFLVISTANQIYIFDIQVIQLHAFDAGLKKLLESECPKKIIHDSRKISDCLYHKHNVKLASVFDTQVYDLFISKNKFGRFPKDVKTLQECLNIYLGVPMNTVEEKLDLLKCTTRPLSLDIKNALAKNIAYFHKLTEIMNNEVMLPINRGVEYYVNHVRSADDYKAWELCSKHKQLPKEFINAVQY